MIVLIILLLFFGPKRLPMLSRSVGESIKEFKGGIAQPGDSASEDGKAEITRAPETASAAAPRETADTGERPRS